MNRNAGNVGHLIEILEARTLLSGVNEGEVVNLEDLSIDATLGKGLEAGDSMDHSDSHGPNPRSASVRDIDRTKVFNGLDEVFTDLDALFADLEASFEVSEKPTKEIINVGSSNVKEFASETVKGEGENEALQNSTIVMSEHANVLLDIGKVDLRAVDWSQVDFNEEGYFGKLIKNMVFSIAANGLKTFLTDWAFFSGIDVTGKFQVTENWLLLTMFSGIVGSNFKKEVPWELEYNVPNSNGVLSPYADVFCSLIGGMVGNIGNTKYYVTSYEGASVLNFIKPMWFTAEEARDIYFKGLWKQGVLQKEITEETKLAIQEEIKKVKSAYILSYNSNNMLQEEAVPTYHSIKELKDNISRPSKRVVRNIECEFELPTKEEIKKKPVWQIFEDTKDGLARESSYSTENKLKIKVSKASALNDMKSIAAVAKEEVKKNPERVKSVLSSMRNKFIRFQFIPVLIKKIPRAYALYQSLDTVFSTNTIKVAGAFSFEIMGAAVQQITAEIAYGQFRAIKVEGSENFRIYFFDANFGILQSIFAAGGAVHSMAVEWNDPKYGNLTLIDYAGKKIGNVNFLIDCLTGSLSFAVARMGTYGSVVAKITENQIEDYEIDNFANMSMHHLLSGIINYGLNPCLKLSWHVYVWPYLMNLSILNEELIFN